MYNEIPNWIYIKLEKGFALFAIILYSGGLVSIISGDVAGDNIDNQGGAAVQVVFASIYFLTGLLLIRNPKKTWKFISNQKYLLLLMGAAILSIGWSTDTMITTRRVVALVGTTLFGIYLVDRYSLEEIFVLLSKSFLIIIFLSFFMSIFMPFYGIEVGKHAGAWKGIFYQKNTLGRMMVVAILTLFGTYSLFKNMKVLIIVGIISAFILLLLSTSATALISLIVVLSIIPVLKFLARKSKYRKPVLTIAIALILICGLAIVYNLEDFLLLFERDATFSGRTILWGLTIEQILASPLFGYGYSVFWHTKTGATAQILGALSWEPSHAHNGILELALDLGVIGVLLFLLAFWSTSYRAFQWLKIKQNSLRYLPVLLLFSFLLFSFTQSIILARNNLYWILFVIFLTSLKGSVAIENYKIILSRSLKPNK